MEVVITSTTPKVQSPIVTLVSDFRIPVQKRVMIIDPRPSLSSSVRVIISIIQIQYDFQN